MRGGLTLKEEVQERCSVRGERWRGKEDGNNRRDRDRRRMEEVKRCFFFLTKNVMSCNPILRSRESENLPLSSTRAEREKEGGRDDT